MLQLITDDPTAEGTAAQAIAALNGGCRWIQIRMKNATDAEVEKAIAMVLPRCRETGATLIVDDRVALAKMSGADGVHLGKNDMNTLDARAMLGPEKIIGATVNSMEDLEALNLDTVDYLGVGPFRFTTTKKRLAPILGLDGYRNIMNRLRRRSDIPAVAIGGITIDDVKDIMNTGVTGIAVSGAINNTENPEDSTRRFLSSIENHVKSKKHYNS